jgi:hypothetical protein
MLDFALPFDAAIERLKNNLLTVPNDALYLFTHHCPISVHLPLSEEDHTFLDPLWDTARFKLGDMKFEYGEKVVEGAVRPSFFKRLLGAKSKPGILYTIQADTCDIVMQPVYDQGNIVSVESRFQFRSSFKPQYKIFTIEYLNNRWVLRSNLAEVVNQLWVFVDPHEITTYAVSWLAVQSDRLIKRINDCIEELHQIDKKNEERQDTKVRYLCNYLGIPADSKAEPAKPI